MFTGIVGALAPIEHSEWHGVHGDLFVDASPYLTAELDLGASVAVDGVCLTVTDFDDETVSFDLVKSTIDDTTLMNRRPGHAVNIERSLRTGSEVGGHEVSGHVDCVGTVNRVDLHPEDVREVTIRVAPEQARFVFPKGFVAVNGVSLTVSGVTADSFSIWLIPETSRRTNLRRLVPGDRVNVEFHKGTQVVVTAIERAVTRYLSQTGEPSAALDTSERAMVMRMLELPAPDGAADTATGGQPA